jgi:Phage tail sheath C-terminal domain
MALSSPGVQVSINDQSQYLPAASNSVPLIVLATAQSKANAAGTAVAAATTKATANKLYQVTSQRDLVTLYGNPFFYKTTNGTPIHGYELNEYGLLAAYSLLGSTNRAYILRADVDLAAFVGSVSRPSGSPAANSYWLDTTNTMWGINEFDAVTGQFVAKTPFVISDKMDVSGGVPKSTIGNIGDYAVIAYDQGHDALNESTYFFKCRFNTWVPVGSSNWKASIPAVTGTVSNPTLTSGNTFTITPYNIVSGSLVPLAPITVTVNGTTVDSLVTTINELNIGSVTAFNISGKLSLSFTNPQTEYQKLFPYSISIGTGNVLNTLGITPGIYYAPTAVYNTSAKMPLWSASQTTPMPTGSVWIKTNAVANGIELVVSKYNATTGSYASLNVDTYRTDEDANATLDSTGGKLIPAGTVYAQYALDGNNPTAPISLFERLATGPTVITGDTLPSSIDAGVTVRVYVSTPGIGSGDGTPGNSSGTALFGTQYTFVTSGTTVESFINNWTAAQIPYTTIGLTTAGNLQITHTAGGQILISDRNPVTGEFTSLLETLGFTAGTTTGVRKGRLMPFTNAVASATSTTGAGAGASFNITSIGTAYVVTSASGGTGYQVGDSITISGSQLGGTSPTNDLTVRVIAITGGSVSKVVWESGTAVPEYITTLSNWVPLTYTANEGAPVALPGNGTYWYYSTPSQVDIMVNKGNVWKGYRNVAFDANGHPASNDSGAGATDLGGPIVAAAAPTTQSDGISPLAYGDLWVDTSDLENYPQIHRWKQVDGIPQWVLIDKSDQTTNEGIVFADARWAPRSDVDPVQDPIPSIASLLTSNHLDLDAPSASLYPQGTLLFNTRRSGYNIKEFKTNYFTGKNYPNAGAYNDGAPSNNNNLPPSTMTYTWVSASGLAADGSAYMGRKAQRAMVVEALKAAIGTNQTIREEDNFFNLIAAPGYPELQPDMVALNNDRNNTAYIVGDTPLRLADQATKLTNWATNAAGATSSGEDGWVTRDSYLGVFYPSGITTDLSGSPAVVPASHMMLRTLLRNDTIAYPWLAPAGTRRGTIDNATNIGYLDATTGEFQTVKNRMSIRDVLYTNQINPLAYFTGIGLLNYGNKNSYNSQSALDRINVARLVAYIRQQLMIAARPFVFEPNDALTRQQITGVVQSLFIDLVSKRGLYDYLVVCDTSNNTPSRIDRNELWIDIAIEPVKAAEFIYIPVRIVNTGALGAA